MQNFIYEIMSKRARKRKLKEEENKHDLNEPLYQKRRDDGFEDDDDIWRLSDILHNYLNNDFVEIREQKNFQNKPTYKRQSFSNALSSDTQPEFLEAKSIAKYPPSIITKEEVKNFLFLLKIAYLKCNVIFV